MCVNVKYVFYYHFNFSFMSENFSSLEYGTVSSISLPIRLYSVHRRCESASIGFRLIFSFVRMCAVCRVHTAVAAVV